MLKPLLIALAAIAFISGCVPPGSRGYGPGYNNPGYYGNQGYYGNSYNQAAEAEAAASRAAAAKARAETAAAKAELAKIEAAKAKAELEAQK